MRLAERVEIRRTTPMFFGLDMIKENQYKTVFFYQEGSVCSPKMYHNIL